MLVVLLAASHQMYFFGCVAFRLLFPFSVYIFFFVYIYSYSISVAFLWVILNEFGASALVSLCGVFV